MSEAFDAYKRAAEIGGVEVIVLEDGFLGLDLDDGGGLNEDVLELYYRHSLIEPGEQSILWTRSRNDNRHAYIRTTVYVEGHALRAAMQTALGSDPLKEAFSTMRITMQTDGPKQPISVLFETLAEAEKVRAWIQAGKEAK